jgi:CBS domain-containing protein
MMAVAKSLQELTARDLMVQPVVMLPQDMPLRDAAHLLVRNRISGAPVVDGDGKCVGVLSAGDFVRLAEKRQTAEPGPLLPLTCSFLERAYDKSGSETWLCTLPEGVCPIQLMTTGPDGQPRIVCRQPHCVLVDWQTVVVERLPMDHVGCFMTHETVTIKPTASLQETAQRMIDAHIHRLVVVDDHHRPIGIVSSTDVLTALARTDNFVKS